MDRETEREGTIAVNLFKKGRIEIQKEIGSGSFGKVLKAVLLDAKTNVAVKVFYQEFIGELPHFDSRLRQSAYDELAKVAVLEHENVVRLLGMVDDGVPWLVFEYMKDGNLLEYVMRNNVKEKTLIRFCRDICNGMAFLHRNNVLHKDLAARNILLDGKIAKISDMGLCSFLTEEHQGSYALGGKLFPYRHAAAECIIECIFTYESDVWSFGVLLFEMFTKGAVPYGPENKQPEVRRFIADGMNPTAFQEPNCSNQIQIVMENIFVTDRNSRPTFLGLLHYFDDLLNSKASRLSRARRDSSPSLFRKPVNPNPLQAANRSSSSNKLSDSPVFSTSPKPSINYLDVHHNPRDRERRHSYASESRSRHGSMDRSSLRSRLSVEERDNPQRRTVSVSKIHEPASLEVEQATAHLYEGFVFNRFGLNKKQDKENTSL